MGSEADNSQSSQPADDIVINMVVGCHYFPPGLQLPFLPESVTKQKKLVLV